MTKRINVIRPAMGGIVLSAVLSAFPTPAIAQQPAPTGEARVLSVNAGVDVASEYRFRGVRQTSSGVATWPSAELSVTPYRSDGAMKRVNVLFGFWNSVNTGDTGAQGPANDAWYESRLYGGIGVQLGPWVSITTTYTGYTSPNELFTTVKEVGVRVDMNDHPLSSRGHIGTYALVAFEVDAQPGRGQLDGGQHAGRYLEFGTTPRFDIRRLQVAIPVRFGLSLNSYYELAGQDHKYGFTSVGATITMPFARTGAGYWNIHGGVEFHSLGDTTKAFNGGDRTAVAGALGIGFIY